MRECAGEPIGMMRQQVSAVAVDQVFDDALEPRAIEGLDGSRGTGVFALRSSFTRERRWWFIGQGWS